MAGWIRGAAVVAGVVAGGAVAVVTVGGRRWRRATARAVEGLERESSRSSIESSGPASPLPAPVARYFAFALEPGWRRVRSARIEHAGQFRTGGIDGRWSPFRSVQHFSADPPGFVWDASIRMAPGLEVRVRDSYIGGRGAMLGKIAGLVPVVSQEGTPELAAGALTRWLAEAVWFPTALLPRPGLRWEAVDRATARVTLADRGNTASMDCRFAEDGRMLDLTAERYRDVGGTGVLTTWRVEFGEYREFGRMRIPARAEVAWILSEGRAAYWRGSVGRAEYRFDP